MIYPKGYLGEEKWVIKCRTLGFPIFLDRLRADSTASGYKRCVDQIVEYAVATKKQIGMRVHHIYPNTTEYVVHCRASGSVKVYGVYIDLFFFFFFFHILGLYATRWVMTDATYIHNPAPYT